MTCTHGTNRLVPPTEAAVVRAAQDALAGGKSGSTRIERWDGRTAERVVGVLLDGEEYR